MHSSLIKQILLVVASEFPWMDSMVLFVATNLPSNEELLVFGTIGQIFVYLTFYIAGTLNLRGVKTGYTRKIVHVSGYMAVAFLQSYGGLPLTFIFTFNVGVVILHAILMGDGNVLYEALARENDAPNRTRFILIPFFATMVGGLITNMTFGEMSIMGYLVLALGDASGEVVGTRFGKHKLPVPPFFSKENFRKTWEGSLSVFIASVVAIYIGLYLISFSMSVWLIFLVALVFTLVEAISPRGTDNLTMQVIPAWLFFVLL